MDNDTLQRQVKAARQRLDAIRRRAPESCDPHTLLSETIENLSNSLEELEVTSEYLREQCEQLHAARANEAAISQRYKDLFDNAPDAYVVTDIHGTIIEANIAASELLGVSRPFLGGKPLSVLVAAQDRPHLYRCLNELMMGQTPAGCELRLRPRSGPQFAALVNVTSSCGATSQASRFRWLFRDITQRKQIEDELRSRFAAIVEFSDDAIMSKTLDGRIVSSNKGAERLYGYSYDDLHGQPISILCPPDRADEGREMLEKVMRGERVEHFETVRLRKDGQRIDVSVSVSPIFNSSGQIIAASTISRDITQRKTLEAALEKREQTLKGFFRCANAGLAIFDTDLRYVQINETLAAMNGLPAEDHIGKAVRDLLPTLATTVEPQFRKVLATGEPLLNLEVTGETPACPSVMRDWMASYFPITSTGGKVDAVGLMLVEVTDLKRAVKALRDSEERFRKIFEDSAVGISLVSLDGRPLAVNRAWQQMLGYTEEELRQLVITDHSFPEDRVEDSQRFQELVQGRRENYRLEKRILHKNGNSVWGNVSCSLIRDSGGHLQFAIAMIEDITERKRAEGELRDLNRRLMRALDELEASQQQIIEQERLRAFGELASGIAHDINNSLSPVLGYSEILLQDTALPQHLCGPIELIHTGASDAAAIVERLGELYRQSPVEPRGTPFRILLPLRRGPDGREIAQAPVPLSRWRILYIDDDPRVRSTVADMLEQLDQAVDVADSGRAGIAMFQATRYDVVMTDLGMPELDGWDVTRAIKEISLDTPVVMLTGWGSSRESGNSMTPYGPNIILGKPLSANKLREVLARFGEQISESVQPSKL